MEDLGGFVEFEKIFGSFRLFEGVFNRCSSGCQRFFGIFDVCFGGHFQPYPPRFWQESVEEFAGCGGSVCLVIGIQCNRLWFL